MKGQQAMDKSLLGSSGGELTQANYTEKLHVGYRWYDAHSVTPKYPFGHGLSYTSFGYSNLEATTASVSCSVRNTGQVKGSEVAQLYLAFPEESGEPPLQLKGFAKVSVAPSLSILTTAIYMGNK
jgi:beta-glucosidase